jgi:hypothetical protein
MDTKFWEDSWLGDKPLAQQYPSLYNIVQWKQVSIANVLNHNPLNISFRRSLSDNRWFQRLHLIQRLTNAQLNNKKDKFVWEPTTSSQFTVKSMYLDLLNDNTKYLRNYIWKMKVPLKVKFLCGSWIRKWFWQKTT